MCAFYREAAYLLTRYLASGSVDTVYSRLDMRGQGKDEGPSGMRVVEYDPPWTPGFTLPGTNVDYYRHARSDEKAAVVDVDTSGLRKRVEVDTREVVLIELGAGMGYVGLAAAESLLRFVQDASKGVAAVVLTDLPDVCVLLKENVALQMEQWKRDGIHGIAFDMARDGDDNGLGPGGTDGQGEDNRGGSNSAGNVTIQVRDLAWGNAEHVRMLSTELCTRYLVERDGEHGPRLTILCSDLVYFPTLLAPLLRSLIQITSPDFLPGTSPQATILIAYRVRSIERETPFWRAFGAWFHFQPILTRSQTTANDRNGPNADIYSEWQRVGWDEPGLSFLFVAHRRPETLDWVCPQDDKELLYGGQVDDTFEILLMLCSANGAIGD